MKIFRTFFLLMSLLLIQLSASAQCAMCRAAAEGNPDIGGGLNAGIEYILMVPYILLGSFAFFVLRGKLKPFWKDLMGKDKRSTKNISAKEWY